MENTNWNGMDMKHFLHSSKWTERLVSSFEKHLCSNSDECRHISELALTSGVDKLWEQDNDNHFSFIAWLLTTDDFKFEDSRSNTISEQFSQKLGAIVNNIGISQALKASLHISCQLRHYFSKFKKSSSFAWWDKETINEKISSHNINYINLQGANLAGASLRGLKLPANLRKANLKGADLSGTDLRGAYLKGALISKKQLTNAIVNHTTELP